MVEPTSLTTQSSGATPSAASTWSGERAHGPACEAGRGAVEGSSSESAAAVDRAQLARSRQPLRAAPEADHLRILDLLAGRQADRAADQANAEDGELQTVSRLVRTASASRSSATTVVSQAMHSSVIDWP